MASVAESDPASKAVALRKRVVFMEVLSIAFGYSDAVFKNVRKNNPPGICGPARACSSTSLDDQALPASSDPKKFNRPNVTLPIKLLLPIAGLGFAVPSQSL